jgi:mono/diheme cytochrome c family protein
MLLLVPVIVACNPDPKDRADAQPPRSSPPNSVAREESRPLYDVGTQQTVERGRERYVIFCSPCHGDAGLADGTAVARGFPEPPSLHEDSARSLELVDIVKIISEGQGRMLPMGDRIAPADRLAISDYVKALQLGKDSPNPASPAAEPAR